MVWPFSKKSSSQEAPADTTTAAAGDKKQPLFLEDVAPKFPDDQNKLQTDPQSQPQQPTTHAQEIKRIVKSLSLADFHIANLVEIPCFREAGLTGFSTFAVFFSVIFLYHKNVRKAANWGFGGLMLGSIFSWEQCNRVRKQSQLGVQLAQERFKQRQLEKMRQEEEANKRQ
ncbi:hypothetical protein CANARDRAFT_8195 [[Candida] arabinofermentans NRRL YB-2248]|uniref:Cytochrome c oxidase assembly protein COX20, mitochondrial n=1 Tax=[Candida] arabinofermentans NRRL YB-2248 TaxID=983967 RepID=A0A1E4T002_9ASCO|nr:hypothetical protein CANARDRAFT_8195 [[Candida] arabinofermentans NRRL YB-2248]